MREAKKLVFDGVDNKPKKKKTQNRNRLFQLLLTLTKNTRARRLERKDIPFFGKVIKRTRKRGRKQRKR